jgi:hypothetical protein
VSDTPANNLRVVGLEEITASIKLSLAAVAAELRDLRTDLRDMRQRQERDFRLLFGAIIFAALSLAGLIARTEHWI